MPALRAIADSLPADRAGIRIAGIPALRPLLAPDGCLGRLAIDTLGPQGRAVRTVLFDKTIDRNWALGWHQDRTIVVRQRQDIAGYGPWTMKRGMQHVAPPFDILAGMVTMRVHLDDVPATNVPLLVARGSHLAGRVAETAVDDVVRRSDIVTCLARAGDVWLYATPILHASAAATVPGRRRVLQIDFAAHALPAGLEWLGV